MRDRHDARAVTDVALGTPPGSESRTRTLASDAGAPSSSYRLFATAFPALLASLPCRCRYRAHGWEYEAWASRPPPGLGYGMDDQTGLRHDPCRCDHVCEHGLAKGHEFTEPQRSGAGLPDRRRSDILISSPTVRARYCHGADAREKCRRVHRVALPSCLLRQWVIPSYARNAMVSAAARTGYCPQPLLW